MTTLTSTHWATPAQIITLLLVKAFYTLLWGEKKNLYHMSMDCLAYQQPDGDQ